MRRRWAISVLIFLQKSVAEKRFGWTVPEEKPEHAHRRRTMPYKLMQNSRCYVFCSNSIRYLVECFEGKKRPPRLENPLRRDHQPQGLRGVGPEDTALKLHLIGTFLPPLPISRRGSRVHPTYNPVFVHNSHLRQGAANRTPNVHPYVAAAYSGTIYSTAKRCWQRS